MAQNKIERKIDNLATTIEDIEGTISEMGDHIATLVKEVIKIRAILEEKEE